MPAVSNDIEVQNFLSHKEVSQPGILFNYSCGAIEVARSSKICFITNSTFTCCVFEKSSADIASSCYTWFGALGVVSAYSPNIAEMPTPLDFLDMDRPLGR